MQIPGGAMVMAKTDSCIMMPVSHQHPNQVLSGFSLGIVPVLRGSVNYDFSVPLVIESHKLASDQTVPIHVYKVTLTIV